MAVYLLLWFPMLLLAIVNGAARDLWYKQYVGELPAHQISTISLLLIFTLYIVLVMQYFYPDSANQAIAVGLLWLVLTLGFEFGFGLWRGNSLSTLVADYNIFKGRLWILVPVWVAIAPYVFYKLFE